ncbi:MAG TPA: biotin/lipoyl-binding protein, partial [Gemmatimonadales bacterium]|nr:biotin/lipoyl-binding protein [Gemmatimonadales bacterium]
MTESRKVGRSEGRKAFALAMLLLVLIAGCKQKAADAAPKSDKADSSQATASTLTLPVVGQEVRKGDLILSVVTTGQVRSEAMSVLKSETQGTIAAVLVRAGDRVRRGQVLLRVDPRPLDLAVREAEANLEKARLARLDNTGPDSIVTGRAITGERLKNAEIR